MKRKLTIILALLMTLLCGCSGGSGHETVTHPKATMTGGGEVMEMDYDDEEEQTEETTAPEDDESLPESEE